MKITIPDGTRIIIDGKAVTTIDAWEVRPVVAHERTEECGFGIGPKTITCMLDKGHDGVHKSMVNGIPIEFNALIMRWDVRATSKRNATPRP